jgi:exopolyphosphatase/guanosine-5'-triphosphate,3'-diphosphate pyrophosphatase
MAKKQPGAGSSKGLRVYLAAPFSSLTTTVPGRAYGEFWDTEFAELLESIEGILKERGLEVTLPHRDRGKWGQAYIDPFSICEMCHELVAGSDIVIALPKSARGVHYEIAWATELRKLLFVFIQEEEDVSIFTPGLPGLGPFVLRTYVDAADLLEQVGRLAPGLAARPGHLASERDSKARVGVVDIGSSTLKMLVAEVSGSEIQYSSKEETSGLPLSDDVNRSGEIGRETVDQLVSILAEWSARLRKQGVKRVTAVASGALRMARNQGSVLEAVRARAGLSVRVLRDHEEAELAYRAVISDFPNWGFGFAVLNVGGGTTDLAVGTKERIGDVFSFPDLGIRKLNASFRSDPPSGTEYEDLVAHIRAVIDQAAIRIPPDARDLLLVHTGGELSYAQSAGYRLSPFGVSQAHPKQVSLSNFVARSEELRHLTRAQLRQISPNPQNPRWMDGALASNALAICFAERLGVKRLIPSDRNISDGLVLESEEGGSV